MAIPATVLSMLTPHINLEMIPPGSRSDFQQLYVLCLYRISYVSILAILHTPILPVVKSGLYGRRLIYPRITTRSQFCITISDEIFFDCFFYKFIHIGFDFPSQSFPHSAARRCTKLLSVCLRDNCSHRNSPVFAEGDYAIAMLFLLICRNQHSLPCLHCV